MRTEGKEHVYCICYKPGAFIGYPLEHIYKFVNRQYCSHFRRGNKYPDIFSGKDLGSEGINTFWQKMNNLYLNLQKACFIFVVRLSLIHIDVWGKEVRGDRLELSFLRLHIFYKKNKTPFPDTYYATLSTSVQHRIGGSRSPEKEIKRGGEKNEWTNKQTKQHLDWKRRSTTIFICGQYGHL